MANIAYTPAKVWTPEQPSGGKFSNINRPVSGQTHDKTLPEGKHNFQLHSLATPNGVKVTIMFEELLDLGIAEAEYDAYPVDISKGEQFSSGFVDINPNSKIPALFDKQNNQRVFESGSILLYLAERFGHFLSSDLKIKTDTYNWLFWQMGSAPFLGGGFGHFYAYAPEKYEYPINRYAMEVKRQLHLLDSHLESNEYMAGADYSIADMAIWPWYGVLVQGKLYEAGEFLDVQSYTHLQRWTEQINARPAVKRGKMVNRAWGNPAGQLIERHDASDFTQRTRDKLGDA